MWVSASFARWLLSILAVVAYHVGFVSHEPVAAAEMSSLDAGYESTVEEQPATPEKTLTDPKPGLIKLRPTTPAPATGRSQRPADARLARTPQPQTAKPATADPATPNMNSKSSSAAGAQSSAYAMPRVPEILGGKDLVRDAGNLRAAPAPNQRPEAAMTLRSSRPATDEDDQDDDDTPTARRRDRDGDGVADRIIVRRQRVTAYCDRGITAAGVPSGVGQCAAPADIPLGSLCYIPALKRYFVVTDRTHKRFRSNTVDLFMPAEATCDRFGVKQLTCEFIICPEPPKYGTLSVRQKLSAAGN